MAETEVRPTGGEPDTGCNTPGHSHLFHPVEIWWGRCRGRRGLTFLFIAIVAPLATLLGLWVDACSVMQPGAPTVREMIQAGLSPVPFRLAWRTPFDDYELIDESTPPLDPLTPLRLAMDAHPGCYCVIVEALGDGTTFVYPEDELRAHDWKLHIGDAPNSVTFLILSSDRPFTKHDLDSLQEELAAISRDRGYLPTLAAREAIYWSDDRYEKRRLTADVRPLGWPAEAPTDWFDEALTILRRREVAFTGWTHPVNPSESGDHDG